MVSAAASNSQTEMPAPNVVNPCNGELVVTTGTVHVGFVSSSNFRHLHVWSNFQDVKGVGAATGFDYVVTGVNQFHFNGNFTNGQSEFMTITNVHIIAPGTGQSFTSTFLFHFGMTASGRFFATLHMHPGECTGMSAKGRLSVGERAASTASVAHGDSAPAASAAPATTGSTTAAASYAAPRNASAAGLVHGQAEAKGVFHRFGPRAR